MGKRSSFERIEKDFYRTIDPRAVAALIPHLDKQVNFAEPCYGSGDLSKELESYGHKCVWQSDLDDIDEPIDASTLNTEIIKTYADLIVTNPPWTRKYLHPIINNLSNGLPTWLLFDADWAHTKQSSEYMKRCVKIVSIGRLIWMPDTNVSGKDNCAWYLFDVNHSGPTEFVGR